MIGDNLLKSNRELHSPHSLFGVMSSGISGNLGADDYDSMYESRSELTVIQKQHFVEWFSGSALDSIWNFTNVTGTGSGAMSDAVDGGYVITSGGTTGDRQQINFNDKRQYSQTGSVIIGICQRISATSAQTKFGLFNTGLTDADLNRAYVENSTSQSYYRLLTGDGSTASGTVTDITPDEITRSHKIECGSANIKLTIDGVLKVTKTTNRPAAILQPVYHSRCIATGARTARITYCEAYNT